MQAITKVARMASLSRSAAGALLPTGPVGWIVFFGMQGASEFMMFSQAEGDAGEWWHCMKERIVLWEPHDCGMVDENGNHLPVKDRGPFMNFVHNFYGPILWEDIDGDGKLESPFTKFVATMQDLGEGVYDFFDASEDGTGFVENTKELFLNGRKTIVNIGKNGWEWFEKKVPDVAATVKKVADKVEDVVDKVGSIVEWAQPHYKLGKVFVNKIWGGVKKLFGHDDDDDD